MSKNSGIKLYLPQLQSVSSLKNKVFEEELMEINKKYPMDKDCINICSTYFQKNEDILEVGFFFRSTLSNTLSLEFIDMALQDEKNNIIVEETFNFKELGTIPPYSAIPTSIKFKLPSNFNYNKDERYMLKFLRYKELKSFSSKDIDLVGLPIDMPYEEEKEIRDFVKGLKTVKENEISVSIFKASRTDEGSVEISMLVRNGYDQDITVDRLPITILNSNGIAICKDKFYVSDGKVVVEVGKARLIKFVIDKSKLYNTVFDLKQCKILFQ